MGSDDNFMTNISERIYISNVNKAYWSTNPDSYIRQMLKHNHQSTHLDNMEETLWDLAQQSWYDSDAANDFNLPSAADTQRKTQRAYLVRLQHCQDKPFFRPV